MKSSSIRRGRRTAVAAAAALLAACSSGSGDGPVPVGAIDGGGFTVFATGPINAFGSVIVNGVRYDTSQAEILVDGQPGSEASLEVGQIVRVTASGNGSGLAAERIEYDDNVEGPIAEIDLAASRLLVLGQTVLVTAGTSFDDDIPLRALDGLAIGDVIEVSGYVDSMQRIVATRIELDDDGDGFEVTGFVTNLDSAAMLFNINGLTVDYSQAVLEDFDGGQPADGDLVEAEGAQLGGNGELVALKVELKDDDFSDNIPGDADIEIEGLITRFASAADFDVAGLPVTTDSGTRYEDGSEADLALDVLVEVKGSFDANGVLVADVIEFENDGSVRIDAIVDAVDAAAGRVTLLGIPVEISAETRLEDDSDLDMRRFSIDDINVGDWLEIRGRETATGSGIVAASRVERDEAENESTIRGFATDVGTSSFRILGLDIDTDVNTEFSGTSATVFFDTAEGRLVEADGNLDGGRFLATQVEFEND